VKIQAELDGEPIPVVYIQRKPNPNGLEIFPLATYVKHPAKEGSILPFILDMRPHLRQGDSAPKEVVRQFMRRFNFIIHTLTLFRWTIASRPHVVADAAFGGLDLLQDVETWGGVATFSMSLNNNGYIWDVLSVNVPPNSWRCAQNDKSWITSSHTLAAKNASLHRQQLISNAFTGN